MNKTFNDVFADLTTFKQAWEDSGFATNTQVFPDYDETSGETDYLGLTFLLLQSRYYSSTIAYKDEEPFKMRLFAIIFQYAPTWWKSIDIQNRLRALTDDEILKGASQKSKHGYNPSTIPDGPNTGDTEIDSVNEQTLLQYSKGKVSAYADLMLLLKKDVTNDYISKFKGLFIKIIDIPCCLYEDEGEQ